MDLLELHNLYKLSSGVTTDSRNCYPGSIFFALKGERFNGNEYAIQALQEGCIYAVVDDEKLNGVPGCIVVPNVLEALQGLALTHRKLSKAIFIARTGSNGKTTTKELMANVLSEGFNVWYTRGNLNNHIGVPLTILSMPPQTEVAVIEMGANHIGEIALLSSIVQPDYGIITNVGKAHLEGFGSFEGIKNGKGELYQFLKRNNAPAFINLDNHHLEMMLGEANKIGYGIEKDDGLVVARNAIASPFLEFEWRMHHSEVWHTVQTNLTGLYNLENALAAICVGVHFKIEPHLINKALVSYEPVNNRSQLTATENNQVLLDAYNANPTSMSAALLNFKEMKAEGKVLIIGGMKELGEDSVREHQAIIELIKQMEFVRCFLVGPEFKELTPHTDKFLWFENAALLKDYLLENKIKGCLALIKGSRSNQLEKVVEAL